MEIECPKICDSKIAHVKNNMKIHAEKSHDLDLRLSGLERECAFFNDKLTSFVSRFDNIDENLKDVTIKLHGIELSMSKNEGAQQGSSHTFNKFWLIASNVITLLAGLGIDKYFLR